MSSQSSHHPQEVLLAQFSLYVHKGGLKPDSFHFLVAFVFERNNPDLRKSKPTLAHHSVEIITHDLYLYVLCAVSNFCRKQVMLCANNAYIAHTMTKL